MERNDDAVVGLSHPTVVPDGEEDEREEESPTVDVTGSHPTVRT